MRRPGDSKTRSLESVFVLHPSHSFPQALYQLAPDEKRRDFGLSLLDTYFNNGVCKGNTHLIAQLIASPKHLYTT